MGRPGNQPNRDQSTGAAVSSSRSTNGGVDWAEREWRLQIATEFSIVWGGESRNTSRC